MTDLPDNRVRIVESGSPAQPTPEPDYGDLINAEWAPPHGYTNTKATPGRFDCYTNAEPDEPMFVLLARDVTAPALVREWAHARVTQGMNRYHDDQIVEAFRCADEMAHWWGEHRTGGVSS